MCVGGGISVVGYKCVVFVSISVCLYQCVWIYVCVGINVCGFKCA